jgi:serine phosphatase RsbU (regulator of sigma subunit)
MVQHQQVARELAAASRIQESFLPQAPPSIPGWQLSVTLEPAGETSGDFYDFIPLLNGRWGIVIADVADKGVGAALYMALSRTLIRTYAAEYHEQPELTLRVVNRRLLAETHCDMFVTVFYAVVDPFVDTVTYCNAGHNPPYLFHSTQPSVAQPAPQGSSPVTLRRTGLPLGVLEDTTWESAKLQVRPGDVIVLYTDGVTEAHNSQEELYGEQRLLQAAQSNIHRPVPEIKEALLAEVHDFVGTARKSDDLTLMVMARSSP